MHCNTICYSIVYSTAWYCTPGLSPTKIDKTNLWRRNYSTAFPWGMVYKCTPRECLKHPSQTDDTLKKSTDCSVGDRGTRILTDEINHRLPSKENLCYIHSSTQKLCLDTLHAKSAIQKYINTGPQLFRRNTIWVSMQFSNTINTYARKTLSRIIFMNKVSTV